MSLLSGKFWTWTKATTNEFRIKLLLSVVLLILTNGIVAKFHAGFQALWYKRFEFQLFYQIRQSSYQVVVVSNYVDASKFSEDLATINRAHLAPFMSRDTFTVFYSTRAPKATLICTKKVLLERAWNCTCGLVDRAEVRRSFITTTVRDKSQVTPQGRHR